MWLIIIWIISYLREAKNILKTKIIMQIKRKDIDKNWTNLQQKKLLMMLNKESVDNVQLKKKMF